MYTWNFITIEKTETDKGDENYYVVADFYRDIKFHVPKGDPHEFNIRMNFHSNCSSVEDAALLIPLYYYLYCIKWTNFHPENPKILSIVVQKTKILLAQKKIFV